ncbi:MAG: serine/threonine protein kinase [Woeseiaceae bacterium]
MDTRTKTLTFDTRFLHLYKPLLRKLLIVLIVTFLLIQAALLYFDERLVQSMSATLIDDAADATEQHLAQIVDATNKALQIALGDVDGIPFATAADDEFIAALAPFINTYALLDSINVADMAGNEFVIIEDEDGFVTRRIHATAPTVAQWRRVRNGEVVETWERQTDVSPTERPWFKGAMSMEPGTVFTTRPYELLTSKEPGISLATRAEGAPASAKAVAFNIRLTEVSEFTMQQHPSENGMSVIFDNDRRVLGLPRHEQFDEKSEVVGLSLTPIEDMGIAAISTAIETWEAEDRPEGNFSFSGPESKLWWAGFNQVELTGDRAFWSAVIVPRADLVGNLVRIRNLSVIGLSALGLLIAGIMFATTMHSIRRQMRETIDRIEQKMGQYVIEEKVGEGGNGTVYRASHALLRRPTALKLMNAEFARSEAARDRFEHEVRLTSGLSHPNTVAIYDFGHTPDGTLYYAMELLEGTTLNRLVQACGPLPADRTIHFLTQACGSLAEAHGKGFVHRDIKPSNLIACERGGVYDVIKVVDFGLVKEMASTDGNASKADIVIGTPFFMAPETISSPNAASPLSDIYALGAVGYFLVSGRHVFEGESAVAICASHLHDTPVRPSEKLGRPVPQDLEDVLMRCLEKDPARRPQNAAALTGMLEACDAAGEWTQDDARAWWQEFGPGITGDSFGQDAVPMTQTEMVVDLDSRLLKASDIGSTPGDDG